jgi:general secretion pathway protein K
MRRLIQQINNNRGIAMIVAVFAMVLAVVVATEIAYETQVEYARAAQSVNRLKAYYAAKAGVELSLFRILLYKKVMAQYGDSLKDQRAKLDNIWQWPFAWPPTALALVSDSAKEDVNKLVKESTMDAQYAVSIESEGSKIDVNALGSPSQALATSTRNQILQIFQNELDKNKAFKQKYDTYKFTDLLDNMQDWVSDNPKSVGSHGDKSSQYKQPEDVHNYKLPPGAPFKTIDELHMVVGMEDEFFDLIKDRITVYGTLGVNVNYAPGNVLASLDPNLKDEILAAVLARRADPNQGGPFKDENDFFGFLQQKGMRTDNLVKNKVPLYFDPEYNFRIKSIGKFSNVVRTLNVVTYDIDSLTAREVQVLNDAEAAATGQAAPTPSPGVTPLGPTGVAAAPGAPGTAQKKVPTGRPTIVLWQET